MYTTWIIHTPEALRHRLFTALFCDFTGVYMAAADIHAEKILYATLLSNNSPNHENKHLLCNMIFRSFIIDGLFKLLESAVHIA